jgi:ribosome-binding protein aMBF1 (putative translation factor)
MYGATAEDFKQTVLKKDKLPPPKKSNLPDLNSIQKKVTYQQDNLKNIEEEKIKLPKVSLDMAKQIQNKRAEMKLTQEQLAQKCGFTKDVIRNYENCQAVPKQSELSKINKALGLSLKMPKKEKLPEN